MAIGKPRISVAMCTFNGERFLAEQLESLERQAVAPFEIVVGDDCSEDGTRHILAGFARRSAVPVRLIERDRRLGHGQNFLDTAAQCSGDWIAFADQDDVWLPHKIEEASEIIVAREGLLLVNQRAWLCDDALKVASREVFPAEARPGLRREPDRRLPLVWPGFLMTFDARLIREFDFNLRAGGEEDGTRLGHGRWIFLLAAALGSWFTTTDPAALYRRHASTITGDHLPQRRTWHDMRARNRAGIAGDIGHVLAGAKSLEALAGAAEGEAGDRLRAAAARYRRAEAALVARLGCHDGEGLARRLAAFAAAGANGAYVGDPLGAAGMKAAVKDAAAALRLLR